jgi:hypothetical protein
MVTCVYVSFHQSQAEQQDKLGAHMVHQVVFILLCSFIEVMSFCWLYVVFIL